MANTITIQDGARCSIQDGTCEGTGLAEVAFHSYLWEPHFGETRVFCQACAQAERDLVADAIAEGHLPEGVALTEVTIIRSRPATSAEAAAEAERTAAYWRGVNTAYADAGYPASLPLSTPATN